MMVAYGSRMQVMCGNLLMEEKCLEKQQRKEKKILEWQKSLWSWMKATSIAIKIQIGKHYKAHDPHRLILIQFQAIHSFSLHIYFSLALIHSLLFNDMMDLSCCDSRDVIKWRLAMLIYEVYNFSYTGIFSYSPFIHSRFKRWQSVQCC